MGDSHRDAAVFRQFSRDFTRRVGVLSDSYLGQARPLGAARVLFEIGSRVSLRELRTRLGLDPGYLSRIIRLLEDEGLVQVSAHPGDSRQLVAALGTAQRLMRSAAVSVQVADPVSADVRGCLAAYVAELRERFPEGFA